MIDRSSSTQKWQREAQTSYNKERLNPVQENGRSTSIDKTYVFCNGYCSMTICTSSAIIYWKLDNRKGRKCLD
jgi:hypothetical protein